MIKTKAEEHEVIHEYSGKNHWFKIKSKSGKSYTVSIKATCECDFMSIEGRSNGMICSHILSTLKFVLNKGQLNNRNGKCRINYRYDKRAVENMIQARRNECLNLVRTSNIAINQIRPGSNEGAKHYKKKQELCAELHKAGKMFITEAILNGSGIADILVLDDFKIIEIADTETDESLEKKAKQYPKGLEIEVVRI